MAKTILEKASLIAILPLLMGCTGSRPQASGPPAVTPPGNSGTVAKAPGQGNPDVDKFVREVVDPLEAGGFQALVVEPPEDIGWRTLSNGLLAGERDATHRTQAQVLKVAVQSASKSFMAYYETVPEQSADLKDWVFIWSPESGGGESRPGEPLANTRMAQLELAAPDELEILLTTGGDSGGESISLDLELGPATNLSGQTWWHEGITREQLALLTSKPKEGEADWDAAYRDWTGLGTWGPAMASSDEARLFAADRLLRDVIFDVAMKRLALPTSVEETLSKLGLQLTNLRRVEDSEAQLLLQFDGVQTYRHLIRFPTGIEYDTVIYFRKLALPGGISSTRSTAKFLHEIGKPVEFKTIGSWRLDSTLGPPL